jgi:5-(carboxyamino)imidazole ribonucleotide synthase
MTCQFATRLGYRVIIYSNEKDSPAFHVCTEKYLGSYSDASQLQRFAASCDVVTYEFENIPLETLKIVNQFVPVAPNPEINAIAQHRIKEKEFVRKAGVATTDFLSVETLEDLKAAVEKVNLHLFLISLFFLSLKK